MMLQLHEYGERLGLFYLSYIIFIDNQLLANVFVTCVKS